MRPLLLKGHERSMTKVKYNPQGDLLFSASKDKIPCVWYSENGERLGTYEGHNGVVWCLDASWDTTQLITGGGDNACILWDVETGKQLHKLLSPVSVRAVGFSFTGHLFFYATDKRTVQPCSLMVFDQRDPSQITAGGPGQPFLNIPMDKSRVTSAVWSHLDDIITTGHESGEICQYDVKTSSLEPMNFVHEHKYQIMDLQLSPDKIALLSASKDHTAKMFDSKTLQHLKTYQSERQVNSAAISPIRDFVVLGGGEEAVQVTQTAAGQGQFESKFYHLIFEEEFARLKGHFGPINSLCFNPDGRSYASGGEDGIVRIQTFEDDDEYYTFDFDY